MQRREVSAHTHPVSVRHSNCFPPSRLWSAKAEKREAVLLKEMETVSSTGNVTAVNLGRVVASQAGEIAELSEAHLAAVEAARR